MYEPTWFYEYECTRKQGSDFPRKLFRFTKEVRNHTTQKHKTRTRNAHTAKASKPGKRKDKRGDGERAHGEQQQQQGPGKRALGTQKTYPFLETIYKTV